MKQSETITLSLCILFCCSQCTTTSLYLTWFHSRASRIFTQREPTLSLLWYGLLLFYRGGHWFAGWWHRWHQSPLSVFNTWRHFICIMNWFEIIVKQQHLIMTASFPCVLLKTPNILENLAIYLPWRNRLGSDNIKSQENLHFCNNKH